VVCSESAGGLQRVAEMRASGDRVRGESDWE